MQIVVHYGQRSFGTGFNATSYAARLNGDDKSVTISSRFYRGPRGRSKAPVSDAQVKGFDMTLDRKEAMQLAAAILGYMNHPQISDAEMIWFAPEEGQWILRNEWQGKIRLNRSDASPERLQFINESRFYLNLIDVQFAFSDEDLGHHQVSFEVGLAPLQSCECLLADTDVAENSYGSEITDISIVSVKGQIVPRGWGVERRLLPRPLNNPST